MLPSNYFIYCIILSKAYMRPSVRLGRRGDFCPDGLFASAHWTLPKLNGITLY